MNMTTTHRLHRTATGYTAVAGRFTITRRYDSSAGRGAMVARGWIVKDALTGITTTHTDMTRVRDFLATLEV